MERVNQNRLRRTYWLLRTPNHHSFFMTYKYCCQQIKGGIYRRAAVRTHGHRCATATLYLIHHSRLQYNIENANKWVIPLQIRKFLSFHKYSSQCWSWQLPKNGTIILDTDLSAFFPRLWSLPDVTNAGASQHLWAIYLIIWTIK